jgi:hypothetical protein
MKLRHLARCDTFRRCSIYRNLCPSSVFHIMSSQPDWIEYVPALQDEHRDEERNSDPIKDSASQRKVLSNE